MMTKNNRDSEILDFLEICPSDSFTVQKLFFPSIRTAQRRLNKLYDAKLIKRYRSHVTDGYIYYLNKKPLQVEHTLYVSKLYVYFIQKGYKILKFKPTPVLGNIIPDAIAVLEINGEIKTYLVEVEISNNSISQKLKNYNEFYLRDCREMLGCKPPILFVTDKKIPKTELEYEVIKLNQI